MTITKITDTFSVSPQITPEEVAEIAKLGFKTIINNRPDNEGGEGQPKSADIKNAAEKHGLSYYHIPVIPNAIRDEDVEKFKQVLSEAPGPILGFCRTGNRASAMYQKATTVSNAEPKGLIAWLKSKCLITKCIRWCKSKCQTT